MQTDPRTDVSEKKRKDYTKMVLVQKTLAVCVSEGPHGFDWFCFIWFLIFIFNIIIVIVIIMDCNCYYSYFL